MEWNGAMVASTLSRRVFTFTLNLLSDNFEKVASKPSFSFMF